MYIYIYLYSVCICIYIYIYRKCGYHSRKKWRSSPFIEVEKALGPDSCGSSRLSTPHPCPCSPMLSSVHQCMQYVLLQDRSIRRFRTSVKMDFELLYVLKMTIYRVLSHLRWWFSSSLFYQGVIIIKHHYHHLSPYESKKSAHVPSGNQTLRYGKYTI